MRLDPCAMGREAVSAVDVEARPEIGQAEGLAELYVRHAPAALRLAYMLTAQRELAEDLVQDAFVKLAGRFLHLRKPEAFEAYLRRMIVNQFLSHLRRRKVELAYLESEGAEARRAPAQLDVTVRDEMWLALQRLPERQRAALVLRYYLGLSGAEIAAVLGISAGTVKSTAARALAALARDLGEPS